MLKGLTLSSISSTIDIESIDKAIEDKTVELGKLENAMEYKKLIQSNINLEQITQYDKLVEQNKQIQTSLQFCENYIVFLDSLDEKDKSMHNLQLLKSIHKILEQVWCFESVIQDSIKETIHFRIQQYQKSIQSMRNSFTEILNKIGWPLKKNQVNQLKISEEDSLLISEYANIESELNEVYKLLDIEFESTICAKISQKPNEAIHYHFIQNSGLHEVNEPGWMFNYILEVFDSIMNLFQKNIINIQAKTLQFIGKYTYQTLIVKNIIERLDVDRSRMIDSQLVFNFFDSLLSMENSLCTRFEFFVPLNLFETILSKFDIGILNQILEFEMLCFQNKIFKDFTLINYSKINLRNLQAFNITQNFGMLISTLFPKYKRCKNPEILNEVNKVYEDILINMISHMKTCFERIYKYNTQKQRYDILNLFKKVDDQLKKNFIFKDLPQGPKLTNELHNYLFQSFSNYSAEMLKSVHKKLFKILQNSVLSIDEQNWVVVQTEWKVLIEKLNEIYIYRDSQCRHYFFSFLQTDKFSKEKLQNYLGKFQSYLIYIFSGQQIRLIRGLLFLEKYKLKEIINSKQYEFLTEKEKKVIKKLEYI